MNKHNKTNRLIDTQCKLIVARGLRDGGDGQKGEGGSEVQTHNIKSHRDVTYNIGDTVNNI